MKKFMLLPLALFVLILAPSAFAQNRAGAVTLSPFVGGYTFECFQHLDTSMYYGLRAGYNFTDHWGFEGMFGYVPTKSDAYRFDNRNVNVFRYGLDLMYNFMPKKKFVPFLAAGYQGIQINDPSGINDHNRGMFDYGVGAKYFITENVALRADVRHDLFCEGDDICSNLEYTGGVTFLLGGRTKVVAVAPPAPLPIPAPVPNPTGCSTIPLNGATKVSVTKDVTASFDGPVANGSFIVTAPDQTRVKGTITYGKSNKMATFAPDAPFAPNTTYVATIKMGAQSLNNNCVWSFTTAPVVLIEFDDTHFAHDSSALTPLGREILDKNVQTLKENPTLNILVAGYTSASGTDEYNQKLSERRATTIRNALIEGGIAPERLTKIGYGEKRPAEYEAYPEEIESRAAKANRRVLFTVIVK